MSSITQPSNEAAPDAVTQPPAGALIGFEVRPMNDRTEYDETAVRVRTIAAAEIIADLTREGWSPGPSRPSTTTTTAASSPALTGVCHAKTDREDVIDAYAEHLGAEVQDPHGDGQYVDVVAELRGVWVRIWARRDAR